MADIQSVAAEIRRGKKEEDRRTNHSTKIYMVSLFHRATINKKNSLVSHPRSPWSQPLMTCPVPRVKMNACPRGMLLSNSVPS